MGGSSGNRVNTPTMNVCVWMWTRTEFRSSHRNVTTWPTCSAWRALLSLLSRFFVFHSFYVRLLPLLSLRASHLLLGYVRYLPMLFCSMPAQYTVFRSECQRICPWSTFEEEKFFTLAHSFKTFVFCINETQVVSQVHNCHYLDMVTKTWALGQGRCFSLMPYWRI